MMYGRLTVNPVSAAWNTVARFDDYQSAQRAVDRLSDDGFPVEQLNIVGSDLQLVERVTGRLTKARAATAGALSGMWAGLLIGILFGLFTTGHAWLAVVAAGIGLGVLWGAIFGFAAHLATRGERDFSSLRGLSAAHYNLVAREGGAERGPDRARTGRAAAARSPLTPGRHKESPEAAQPAEAARTDARIASSSPSSGNLPSMRSPST